jgi:NAD+ diphosphatase
MTDAHEETRETLGRSAGHTFASLAIDRAASRRRDDSWISEQLDAPSTRFLPVWGSKVWVTGDSPPRLSWIRSQDAAHQRQQAESVILLGEYRAGDEPCPGDKDRPRAYVALGFPPSDEPPPSLVGLGTFRRLRAVAPLLDDQSAALLAYAKALVQYHHQHQFCGACGAPTAMREGGHLRVCTNPECGQHDFPRTDPAIIVLVSSGERCLLGRQPTWPASFYSIIAGFVEPGESLEGAVAREVREETGIQVQRVRYHSSQPWPFPRSLMIGFTAEAGSTAIQLNDGELEDARWLSRDAIARELEQNTLRLPSPISISHHLIEAWFDAESPVALRDVLKSA